MHDEKVFQSMRLPNVRRRFLPSATEHVFTVFCLAVVLFLISMGCKKEEATTAAPPPVEVEVVQVVQKDVPIISEWIGTTEGMVNATIRAQVTGYLMNQNYKEGSFVKKGDLLFEIDPRPFKAALDQAEGQLAQARARLGKTELDVKRYTPLARESAISQQELDDAIQANLAARAGIQSAQAAVEQAKLNLGFTRITSPINGIAGSANAQIGDLVGPGQGGALTTVSTVDPIKVTFPISEQEYMAAAQKIAKGEDRGPEAGMELELILADGNVFPQKGKFLFADRQVDVRTGTIRISAVFPNPGNILRPGQYARARAQTKVRNNALLIPQRSVSEMQGVYQVAVLGPEDKIQIRPVKMAERVGPLWVVEEGLKPGEIIVVEGIQKVREGQGVQPKLLAHPDPAPSPPESQAASSDPPKKD